MRSAVLLAVCLAAGAVTAQDAGESAAGVSMAVIESRLEQVQASTSYPEAVRSSALELYRQALANLQAAEANREAAERYEQARGAAPAEAQEIRLALARKAAVDPLTTLGLDGEASAREVEQRLQQERANGAAVQAKLEGLEQQLAAEETRPQLARQRLARATQESRRIAQNLAEPPAIGESDLVIEARRWSQQTAAAALTAEIRRLDQELLSQPARVELLQAQRDQAATNLSRIQTRIAALQERLGERRRSETAQLIQEADLASMGEAAQSAVVRELAVRNQELATELGDLSLVLETEAEANDAARAELESLQSRYDNTRQKMGVGGISPALGRYLGEERRNLPSVAQYRRESRNRETAIAEAGLRDIRLDEQWRRVRDSELWVEELLAPLAPEEAERLRETVTALAETRRSLVQQAMELNDDYLRLLADTEYIQGQLVTLVAEYRDYLAERLLWVRSKPLFGPGDLAGLPAEVLAFLSPALWLDAAGVVTARLLRSPLQLGAVLILLLFWWRLAALRAMLRDTATKVGKPSADSFGQTLKAVGLTLLMTLPWPILTAVTGYELSASVDATQASTAVGRGLLLMTPLLFFLRAFRLLCTPKGVAEGHFRWSPAGLSRLRQQMDLLLFTLLAPGFAMVVNYEFREAELGGALSQLLLVALAIGLMIFLHRLLTPKTGIVPSLRRRGAEATNLRGPWLWMTAATVIPAGVAVMALAGFMYSAGTLLGKLINSMWLLFGLVFLRELIFRWLLVLRRRLLLQEALERREAARQARAKGEVEAVAATAADEHAGIVPEDSADVGALDADTRKLVDVALAVGALIGVGAIWSSVLPALGIFGDITLWQQVQSVGDTEQLAPVTLGDLLISLLAIVLTFVAARTVPSLIEIVLRQRPTITPGSRLAFTTLARYTIVGVGLGFALVTIGVNWSKLQWLVAALGVGIGFGLQEIVANFISGLIILVERPVRVGDIVTVGDTSGAVTRIQIRATTIRTWDRQELLVPNKEFITGRVLNWSLSDDVIRIHFLVGVAYGSDVELALKLIAEAAAEHPNVLDEPAPLVTFEQFGDNSLNLGLRCFVPSLSTRLETTTDLHKAINRKFNEAGIVIAFPQRDVHLDTSSPLEIRLMQGMEPTGGADQPQRD